MPEDFKTDILVKIPKNGDWSDCKNWRGLTLLRVAANAFNNAQNMLVLKQKDHA